MKSFPPSILRQAGVPPQTSLEVEGDTLSCAADSAGAKPSRPSAPSAEASNVAHGNGSEATADDTDGADANSLPLPLHCGSCGMSFRRAPCPENGEWTVCGMCCDHFWHVERDGVVVCGVTEN